jgi:8-oxo-dGTP pyrophosphatase MutT (NUDIX family)
MAKKTRTEGGPVDAAALAGEASAPDGRAPKTGKPPGKPPAMPTEHHRSSGGLVVDGARILLISTQKGRRWQLPKGHIETGETPEQAAVREVREETGVTGRVVAPLPSVEYWYVEKGRNRVHKKVDYFLLEYVGGDAADFDAGEVSGAEWFSWDEGLSRMSFENERRVARQAREAAAALSPAAALER